MWGEVFGTRMGHRVWGGGWVQGPGVQHRECDAWGSREGQGAWHSGAGGDRGSSPPLRGHASPPPGLARGPQLRAPATWRHIPRRRLRSAARKRCRSSPPPPPPRWHLWKGWLQKEGRISCLAFPSMEQRPSVTAVPRPFHLPRAVTSLGGLIALEGTGTTAAELLQGAACSGKSGQLPLQ